MSGLSLCLNEYFVIVAKSMLNGDQFQNCVECEDLCTDESNLEHQSTMEFVRLEHTEYHTPHIVHEITRHIESSESNNVCQTVWMLNTDAISTLLRSLEHDHLVKLLNLKDSYGYTLLHHCALEKRCDVLQLIAKHLSEKDWYTAISRANTWKWTPFHWSC